MFYSTKYDSPVGKLTLAADGAALNGLWIEGQKYFGDTIPEEMTERGGCRCSTLRRRGLTGISPEKRRCSASFRLLR